MKIQTLRKKLKALNTNQRRILSQRCNVGEATIHRIANGPEYLPSLRTIQKIVSEL